MCLYEKVSYLLIRTNRVLQFISVAGKVNSMVCEVVFNQFVGQAKV